MVVTESRLWVIAIRSLSGRQVAIAGIPPFLKGWLIGKQIGEHERKRFVGKPEIWQRADMLEPVPQPRPSAGARTARLFEAEASALRLLDRIEDLTFVRAGRTEREVELDIRRLAEREFGVERHWHKRIVRSGINTLATAHDNPPTRRIGEDDMVFLDLGPVFADWEADVGKSYAIGPDLRKHALCAELALQFDRIGDHFRARPDITGAELYAFACGSALAAGWTFGGRIAGHIVAEFPHARLPGPKQAHHISPENPDRLRDPDTDGNMRHWILEVHLVDPQGGFGGFYERLMADSG